MSKKNDQDKRCVVVGCPRKHMQDGFCSFHYSRWRDGVIDENGNNLRDIYKDRPFNRALRKTLILVRQAGNNTEEIQQEVKDGNRFLKQGLNKRILDINRDTSCQESRLVEKDFIFGNIHLLQPSTLQMVLLRNPIARKKSLTTADKARIAWHLIRGKKSEKVAEMFPTYSLKQIMDVAKQIREGKLPLLVKTLKERSIKLQKGKKQC